ncbi:MAG: amidohydrolase [Chloroflexi bacterium]|nr:MAG: amidohydrolase [Chloroflexota bacterium]
MTSELRNPAAEIDAITAEHLLTHRRELHASPELSFKEIETAHYIVERLEALAPDRLQSGVAGTGVVADFKGQRPGRSVLVRADMDGLPIQEASDLPFGSTRRGVMHACGHDVHMAIALEVARFVRGAAWSRDGERRHVHPDDSRQGRSRRTPPPDHRCGGDRGARRDGVANAGQPRDLPGGPGRDHPRQYPRRHRGQHRGGRGRDPGHPADLRRASAP